jgi:LPXTG-motif cell wall-anchored protein
MVSTSPDGRTVAISHWGNNTVGLIDISSNKPEEWKHKMVLVVDKELELNYPLNRSVDRDNGSGYALRGTVFTPDNRYLIVGCMGGGGGIAVIDIQEQRYLGRVLGMMSNVRHLVISNGYLYLSINGGGMVQRMPLKDFMDIAKTMNGTTKKTAQATGWENCKVGTGARTISISPDGRYIFAACNNVSQVYVVDTKTMKTICNIPVDSYPVGLDLSSDGRYVFVTSQGRSNRGGNAVNIYEVEYKNPPTERFCPACGAPRTEDLKQCPKCQLQYEGMTVMNDSTASSDNNDLAANTLLPTSNTLYYAGGALVAVLAGAFLFLRSRRKK